MVLESSYLYENKLYISIIELSELEGESFLNGAFAGI